MSVDSTWSEGFIRELAEKPFREAYLSDQIRAGIAYQIRAMREQSDRDWTQAELGERMGKPQSTVARLEDPDYGKLTLTTLLQVASAFDVALLVQFVEWDDFLNRMDDVSPVGLSKRSFDAAAFLGKPKSTPKRAARAQLAEGAIKQIDASLARTEQLVMNLSAAQNLLASKQDRYLVGGLSQQHGPSPLSRNVA